MVLALAACGGDIIDTPEDIPVDEFAAGTTKITVTMTSCSDICAEYDEPQCTSEVSGTDIKLDATVSYTSKAPADGESCSLVCGPAVLAHCSVPALPAGTYTVTAGALTKKIHVR